LNNLLLILKFKYIISSRPGACPLRAIQNQTFTCPVQPGNLRYPSAEGDRSIVFPSALRYTAGTLGQSLRLLLMDKLRCSATHPAYDDLTYRPH